MIAAQQYYIEYNNDMNGERLMNLLPNYIPDYCLTGDKPVEYWHQLITQAFRKVRFCCVTLDDFSTMFLMFNHVPSFCCRYLNVESDTN